LIARWRIQMSDSETLGEAEDQLIEKTLELIPDDDEIGDSRLRGNDEEGEIVEVGEIEETDEVENVDEIGEIARGHAPLSEEADEIGDTLTIQPRPKEITLEYLMEQRRLSDEEAQVRKEEEAKSLEQKRKETAALKKQQEKERAQLQRQKAKEAKERERQRKKEQKEKERLNKQRQKEREAQRRAEQKAKANTQNTRR
jgi:hypothetical protein